VYKAYLRWYLIIGIIITLFILSWLLLTPSLSTEVFVFHYSFRRFVLNLAVGLFLIVEILCLILISTKLINRFFEWLINSIPAYWSAVFSSFVLLGVQLFVCFFIYSGGENVLLEQILPILGLIYYYSIGLIVIQYFISKGEKINPIIYFLVGGVNFFERIIKFIIIQIRQIGNKPKEISLPRVSFSEMVHFLDISMASFLYKIQQIYNDQ